MGARTIRAIIMDAGGVLLFPNLDWLSVRAAGHGLAASRELLFSAYYRTVHDLDLDASMAQQGPAFTTIEARQWFFGRMFAHAGNSPRQAVEAALPIAQQAAREFPRESDIYHWAMPGLRGRLERLQGQGFLLGSASNNDGALEDQLSNVGVRDLFASLRDSGIDGVSKPDPELLLRAAKDLGVAPQRCLYIGDVDRVDGQAARAAGMAFALIDPLGQPRPTRPLCMESLDQVGEHFDAG